MKFVVLSPREEHWDGTGGAIATWVTNVQVPSNENPMVFGSSPEDRCGWYRSPRRLQVVKRIISRTSTVVGRRTRRNPKRLENALWMRGFLYVLLLLPELRNADVVYIHNRPLYAKYLRRLGFSGTIVLHMHNEVTSYFRRMSRQQLSAIDSYVFCSDFIRLAAVETFSLPYRRTSVLYNGVPENKDLDIRPIDLNLLFVGRLQEIKGPDVAIATVALLRAQGYTATLRLIGGSDSGLHDSETPYTRSLRQDADKLNAMHGSEVIRFLGPLPLDTVLKTMSDASIFIFPARGDEAFGMVLAEAISRGAYPVVTTTGGMPEILQIAGLGHIKSPFTAQEFANEILSAQYSVTDQARKLAATRILSRLKWPRICEDYALYVAQLFAIKSQVAGSDTDS